MSGKRRRLHPQTFSLADSFASYWGPVPGELSTTSTLVGSGAEDNPYAFTEEVEAACRAMRLEGEENANDSAHPALLDVRQSHAISWIGRTGTANFEMQPWG